MPPGGPEFMSLQTDTSVPPFVVPRHRLAPVHTTTVLARVSSTVYAGPLMRKPTGFTYALEKLERAVEELVRAGEIRDRLFAAAMAFAPVFPEDFPDNLREDYMRIREALTAAPPEGGAGQGTVQATIGAMGAEEAGALSKKIFSLYKNAVDFSHEAC